MYEKRHFKGTSESIYYFGTLNRSDQKVNYILLYTDYYKEFAKQSLALVFFAYNNLLYPPNNLS